MLVVHMHIDHFFNIIISKDMHKVSIIEKETNNKAVFMILEPHKTKIYVEQQKLRRYHHLYNHLV